MERLLKAEAARWRPAGIGILGLALIGALAFWISGWSLVSADPPAGFEKTRIIAGLNEPIQFRLTPDGAHFLVAEKKGKLRVFDIAGKEADRPFLELAVSAEGERGLLGFELDPNFSANGHVYVFYTTRTLVDRLSRFTSTDGGRTASPASEAVLFQATQASGLFHHGGQVRFGPDGNLWWSMGDNTNAPNAQDLSVPHGKLLRIRPDGSIPADNPFVDRPTAHKAIWASGLRNPFRFDFLPDGRPIVADVGQAAWEEVNIIQKGGNYGWPAAEGDCGACAYINPVFAYSHQAGGYGAAISSALVYSGDLFPVEYQGSFFYADYVRGFMKRLVFDADHKSVVSDNQFDPTAGAVVDTNQGADGTLYFLTIYPGELLRVAPADNRAPVVKMAADPVAGLPPLTVNFAATGSYDPDGDALTYKWDFGDGAVSASPNPAHIYERSGVYRAALEISDGQTSAQDALTITVGNRPPSPEIISPLGGARYDAGDTVAFNGRATDPEDGDLPASAFQWKVVFHHNEHTHPFLDDLAGVKAGSFWVPVDSHNDPTTWHRIELTITDSGGLSNVTTADIYPNLATLTINTQPSGLRFEIEGTPYSEEFSESAVVGTQRLVSAPSPQLWEGRTYRFSRWSDGGAATHWVETLAGSATYTAVFVEAPAAAPAEPLCGGSSAMTPGADGEDSGNPDGVNANITQSASEVVWRSHNVQVGGGSPQGTVADDGGTQLACLEFYQSATAGGIDLGAALDSHQPGSHTQLFNNLSGYWTLSASPTAGYPYIGKSGVGRGRDEGESGAPTPLDVSDLQLHPPSSDLQVVAAFVAPYAGEYSVSDLAARRVLSWGRATTLRVFDSTGAQVASLQAASRAWVGDGSSYSLGSLAPGDRIYFAAARDGSFYGDATEIAWTVRLIPAPPTINSFAATPAAIAAAGSATLAWETANAAAVYIDQGVGEAVPTGSVLVSPAETTTYTLTATGLGGSTVATATVVVTPTDSTKRWHSYDAAVQAGTAQGIVKDESGTNPAILEFYESATAGGVGAGSPFDSFLIGPHTQAFNNLSGYWTLSDSPTAGYPYAGKSSVERGMDSGESGAPDPPGVSDLQLHPPSNNHLVVAAFVAPEAGVYSVSDLAARRVMRWGETSTLRVFGPSGAPVAQLKVASRVWVADSGEYNVGSLLSGDRIYFAVDREGDFSGDATEVAWTIRLAAP